MYVNLVPLLQLDLLALLLLLLNLSNRNSSRLDGCRLNNQRLLRSSCNIWAKIMLKTTLNLPSFHSTVDFRYSKVCY